MWYGTYDHKPDGSWDRTAEKMLVNFTEAEHPVFRGTSALERGDLRSKGSGKKPKMFGLRRFYLQSSRGTPSQTVRAD